MLKSKLILLVVCIFSLKANANVSVDSEMVKSLMDLFRTNDRVSIVQNISYPLDRTDLNQISSINSPIEMLHRFNEVFDDDLVDLISTSSITDWRQVGQRGVMLNSGIIWLDSFGKIIAVNHTSDAERSLARDIDHYFSIFLHQSVNDFKSILYTWVTKDYRVMIYRSNSEELKYASWPIARSTLDEPDLVLNDGAFERFGNGGYYRYSFSNGSYLYQLSGQINSEKGSLEVYAEDRLVLQQETTKDYLFGNGIRD